MIREWGLEHGTVFTRQQALSWFSAQHPEVRPATIPAYLIKLSTNAHGRVPYHVDTGGADDLFYQIDSQRYRRYNLNSDPLPIHKAEDIDGGRPPRRGPEASEFAYEKDLQSFLAKNLWLIEPGLHLYEEEGVTGIQYPAGRRYIDILAVDKANNLVVIELKVSRGYDRVIGQLLRYVAWIERNLADPNRSVRGLIIARKISGDLRLAASMTKVIDLYEYKLSVTLSPVTVDPQMNEAAREGINA